MPIYEYECKKCKDRFELLVRPSDREADLACPSCRSKKIRKLMSAVAGGKSGCSSCTATSCSTA
jgi:putative FmdB family regulatory protein